MSSIFYCSNVQGYKNRAVSHEDKFRPFMFWAAYPKDSTMSSDDDALDTDSVTFAIQVVKQVNYGPLESKRYFVKAGDGDVEFFEVTERWLIDANFEKLNT
jgi:hypothetical protein